MMTILVLGAGRSSASLISYLLDQAPIHHFTVVVADVSLDAAREKVGNHPKGKAVSFDIQKENEDLTLLSSADIVISLLPPFLHPVVARHCLALGKHLLTASYVSKEMPELHDEALAKGLLFLNECGLDPGIDHMSSMQLIHRIQNDGGKLVSFESFTGGLIASETDPENPWRYKFTWNPKNVVMAGQGTAKYLENGNYRYISYQQLFKRITPVYVPGYGDYEGYVNRDSLQYIDTYGLKNLQTMVRGTLRNKGFCRAWDIFVQLGCCDDSFQMEKVGSLTHAGFLNSFLPGADSLTLRQKIARQLMLPEHDPSLNYLEWSGLFSDEPVGIEKGSPATVLEHILNKRWKLQPEDKDQIVMWHRFVYELSGIRKEIQASLVATGSDSRYTAMAKTVGLPLGIAAKLLLTGRIRSRGVLIPISPEFYNPILKELATLQIELTERAI